MEAHIENSYNYVSKWFLCLSANGCDLKRLGHHMSVFSLITMEKADRYTSLRPIIILCTVSSSLCYMQITKVKYRVNKFKTLGFYIIQPLREYFFPMKAWNFGSFGWRGCCFGSVSCQSIHRRHSLAVC